MFHIDDKARVQAKSRTNPTRPAQPRSNPTPRGTPHNRSSSAAATAQERCSPRSSAPPAKSSLPHRLDPLRHVAFIAELDSLVPAHLGLRCIVDNLANDSTVAVEKILDDHHQSVPASHPAPRLIHRLVVVVEDLT